MPRQTLRIEERPRILPDVGIEVWAIHKPCGLPRDEHPRFEVAVAEAFVQEAAKVSFYPSTKSEESDQGRDASCAHFKELNQDCQSRRPLASSHATDRARDSAVFRPKSAEALLRYAVAVGPRTLPSCCAIKGLYPFQFSSPNHMPVLELVHRCP
jgi:hypothetical protein